MVAYQDLSQYSYSEADEPMVNVGWLGKELPFPKGDVPEQVLTTLTRLAVFSTNVMRGLHDCEFCDQESPIRIGSRENGQAVLGTGEIHVRGADGTIWAAPTLVVHYIAEHRYCPPAEFLEALLLAEN